MKTKHAFLFVGMVLLFFSSNTFSQLTLHAIVVADTNDETIGLGVQKDVKNIKELLDSIAQYTGLRLESDYISGSQFNRYNVEQSVNRLSVGTNDVVIFYYTGHGARELDKKSKWPSLAVEGVHSSVRLGEFLEFDWVIEQLKNKNPRFLIAIADACNNSIFASPLPGSKSRSFPSEAAYRHLFLNHQGTLIASSSKPGQKSWTSGSSGSLFTQAFLMGLEAYMTLPEPSWQTIMEVALSPIQFRDMIQQPQAELDIKKYTPPVGADDKHSIQLSLSKTRFRLDETMQIHIQNKGRQRGYLFVWDINGAGKLSTIFPNYYTMDHLLNAGETITIPEPKAGFSLTIREPMGASALVGVLVDDDLVQQVSLTQLESLSAFNTQSAVQQLRNRLTNQLGQHGWSIVTVEYQITR